MNARLKQEGIITWFDEERMTGHIQVKMAEGIDNTNCAVVFVTERYQTKANGHGPDGETDNCFFEFGTISRKFGSDRIVVVVMEERMLNTRKWSGIVGARMGGILYTNLTSDDDDEFERGCLEIIRKIRAVGHQPTTGT